MTPPLTLQPDRPMETPTASKTTSTQLFGVLYITLMGMIDTMVPNSGPWSLLGQSHPSYGGHYPLAQPYSIPSQPMPLPMPGFLKFCLCSYLCQIIKHRSTLSSEISFDNPPTQLMYYDAQKLFLIRHVNLDQVTNLYYFTVKQERHNRYSMHSTKPRLKREKDSNTLTPLVVQDFYHQTITTICFKHTILTIMKTLDSPTVHTSEVLPHRANKTRKKPEEINKQAKLSPNPSRLSQK
ncbi:hypothetical protein DSO57_1001756 [Entomophthora muscae]|uniref:Uncharacterized protein n=1 Tax=Entomophthora muscae TaxID=34485 RepID=A0ACC2T9L2_9FUNG|nr:hypothetical protein DSO57_1001756 [Entomophthora muscae]